MSFINIVKQHENIEQHDVIVEANKNKDSRNARNAMNATNVEELLRSKHYKIKLVLPTKFGTQIDFAKQYDKDEIEEVLSDYNINIKNNSVFVFNS